MPGIVRAEIRNLTFHPRIAILTFNMRAHRRHQIAHRPYAAIQRLETESELVGRRHCCEVYRKEPSAFSTQHSACRGRCRFQVRRQDSAGRTGRIRHLRSEDSERRLGWRGLGKSTTSVVLLTVKSLALQRRRFAVRADLTAGEVGREATPAAEAVWICLSFGTT